MKKRILSSTLTLAMVLSLFSGMTFGINVSAEDAPADVTNGLVAQYKFDETEGATFANSATGDNTASDASYASEDNAGYWGNPSLIPSNNGRAYSTGNTHRRQNTRRSAIIPADKLAGVTNVTISTYVKVNGVGGDYNRLWGLVPTEMGQHNNNVRERSLSISNRAGGGEVALGMCYFTNAVPSTPNGEQTAKSVAPFSEQVQGAYRLVTFTQNGRDSYLYVDGVQVATHQSSSTSNYSTVGKLVAACKDGKAAFHLGSAQEWDDDGMDAEFDDFKVYNRALSAAELLAQTAKFKEGKADEIVDAGLIYDIDFNESVGNTVVNKVEDSPNMQLRRYDIEKVAGSLGDGAINFKSRDAEATPNIYATANTMKNKADQTLSMWIKPERTDLQFLFTAGPLKNIIGEGGDNGIRDNWSLGIIIDGRLKWEAKANGQSGAVESGRQIFEPNKWYLLTFQNEGTTGRIYINGTLVGHGEMPNLSNMKFNVNATETEVDYDIQIGGTSVWGDRGFIEQGLQGQMDEFRMYDRALSQDEIKTIYSNFTTKANMTPVGDLTDIGEGVIQAWTTTGDFGGFGNWHENPDGDGGRRGKAMTDGSVVATRYGGTDAFLWGPRVSEDKRDQIVTGETYYVKTLVRASNIEAALDKRGETEDEQKRVFTIETPDGAKYATFDKDLFDSNPALYGGTLLRADKWVSLVWPFEATDDTDRGREFTVTSNWGMHDHESGNFLLQVGNKVVLSSDEKALALPKTPTAPAFYGGDPETSVANGVWDQGEDVAIAWDLNHAGGHGRRMRLSDGSNVAREWNHIFYGFRTTDVRPLADDNYYIKVTLKIDNYEKVKNLDYIMEWDWTGDTKPVSGKIMPSEFEGREGEWITFTSLATTAGLNADSEGRFHVAGGQDYGIYIGKYLVVSTDDADLALPETLLENQTAKAVAAEALVSALPDPLTVADADAVAAALKAYDDLSDMAQGVFTPAVLTELQAAEARVDVLVAEKALSDIPDIATADKDTLEAAIAAYDKLTDAQKDSLSAEAKEAIAAARNKLSALTVDGLINALPAVDALTPADKAVVEAARAAFEALSADAKAFVTAATLDKLTAAETKITNLTVLRSITISGKKVVNKGKKITLKSTFTPSEFVGKVTWKSSKTGVATVNASGVVTGKKAGTTTITATCGTVSRTWKVTVKAAITKVKMKKATYTLKKRKSVKLAKQIKSTTPAKAYALKANYKYSIKKADKKFVTLTKKGVVKWKRKSKKVIKVTIRNGKKKVATVKIRTK